MLAHIDALGLTLHEAASRARIDFAALSRAIHGPPEQVRAKVIAALVGRLGMPLAVVAPDVSSASCSQSATTSVLLA